MGIIIFVGRLGSGKTIGVVAYGLDYKEVGYDCQSNIWIEYAHEWDYRKVLRFEIEGVCLIVDEIDEIMDSRNNPQANIQMSYFLKLSRKLNTHVLATTQRMNLVDVRFRDRADKIIECWRYPPLPPLLPPKTPVPPPYWILFVTYEPTTNGEWVETVRKRVNWEELEPYSKMYHTREVVLPMERLQMRKLDFSEVLKTYELTGRKGSFTNMLERAHPSIGTVDLDTVFDLLKNEHVDEAREFIESLG